MDNIKNILLDLELKIEHAQRDIEDLKETVRTLSFLINNLQLQINDLIESK